jgi:hypothetical protein
MHGREITSASCPATGATYHISIFKLSQALICVCRPASGSLWSSVASLICMHNQTINVYSHLVGAMIFINSPIQLYRDSQLSSSLVQWEDYLILTIYCYGVATCLLFSSMFVSSQQECQTMHADRTLDSTFCVTIVSRLQGSVKDWTTSAY